MMNNETKNKITEGQSNIVRLMHNAIRKGDFNEVTKLAEQYFKNNEADFIEMIKKRITIYLLMQQGRGL